MGLVQSLCFPAFVSVIANWFSAKNRGIAVGGFCTSTGLGNLMGAQVGSILLSVFSDNWPLLFVILTALSFVLAIVIRLFMVSNPEEVGYLIDEDFEKEQISKDT